LTSWSLPGTPTFERQSCDKWSRRFVACAASSGNASSGERHHEAREHEVLRAPMRCIPFAHTCRSYPGAVIACSYCIPFVPATRFRYSG
jgi:hypothetical protein